MSFRDSPSARLWRGFVVALGVMLGANAGAQTAPVITTQPQSQTINAGLPVTFTVVATGTPAPIYQWRKGGTAIPGATATTLTLASAQASDAGSYDVVVTNTGGSVTSSAALLTVSGPTVANVALQRRSGTKLVDITYDLIHPQGWPSAITVEVSQDGGATWLTAPLTLTGAVGAGVTPGTGKLVTWNAGADWPAQRFATTRARVTADDLQGSMVLIPGGTFTMGDALDGDTYGQPTHAVTLAAFYLAKTETTWTEWVAVRDWAVTHGYTDLASVGAGKADTHPVQMVSWYDVIKWCNAKSEKEGLVPVYYTNDAQTTVYRTGSVNVTNTQVKWTAGGYRLPTEAEWEYAARGGMAGKRFPWGNTIAHSQANYRSSTSYSYDVSPTRGDHPTYTTGGYPYTSPAGAFAANGYGLFDMAGNVWEWCWDWYGSYGSAAQANPRGASSGTYRVVRGGCWATVAISVRSADRDNNNPDVWGSGLYGFRPARSSVP